MTSGVGLAECRTCAEPIRFVQLNTGSKMPVNPKPDDRGNVAAKQVDRDLVGRVLRRGDHQIPAGHQLYRPHFATCERPKAKPKPEDPGLF